MSYETELPTDGVQSPDTVLNLLKDERRRYAVAYLSAEDSRVHLDELARAVAARETGADADRAPADTVDQVALTLHHAHLPKLTEYGIVDYDTGTNMVTPTRPGELTPFLGTPDTPGE